MKVYTMLNELIKEGADVALATVLEESADGVSPGEQMIFSSEKIYLDFKRCRAAELVINETFTSLGGGQTGVIEIAPGTGTGKPLKIFVQRFLPPPVLIILGAGHVGAALGRFAACLDYKIYLVDDRPSFANKSRHPYADQVICDNFEAAFKSIPATVSDYIVIVTRGHSHDHLCLKIALRRPAAYIGMIGSKHKVKAQLKELKAAGFMEPELKRLHAPIGLKIGAVSEAEIALSILAEITQVRRTAYPGEVFQEEVMAALAELEKDGARAVLATIIKALGSTPRKQGSQMLIYPDGSTVGTIGGGCAEGEVKQLALSCIDQGKSTIMQQELTAEAAAAEGMACGGKMELFLQLL